MLCVAEVATDHEEAYDSEEVLTICTAEVAFL